MLTSYTSTRTHSISGKKLSSGNYYFWQKNYGKKWSIFLILKLNEPLLTSQAKSTFLKVSKSGGIYLPICKMLITTQLHYFWIEQYEVQWLVTVQYRLTRKAIRLCNICIKSVLWSFIWKKVWKCSKQTFEQSIYTRWGN